MSSRVGSTRARQTTGLSLRGVISAFALLAFIFSGFATQTHIHIPGQSEPGVGAQQVAAQTIAAKDSTSLNREQKQRAPTDDPTRCPLCQEYLHSGAYVTPVPAVFPLPILTATVAPFLILPAAIIRAVSHSWYGRAPPLA
jgi:hypothetical protein